MIRIIAGKYRGRKLKVPVGNNVRPTSERVREALFNILSSLVNWEEVTVLDLYAGSGALGLEALSRGAGKVFFVEVSRKHLSILRENIATLSPEVEKFEAVQDRAERWLSGFTDSEQMSLTPCVVFVDPPYAGDEYGIILKKLALLPAIRKESLLVVEAAQTTKIAFPEKLELLKHHRYGSVTLDILRKS